MPAMAAVLAVCIWRFRSRPTQALTASVAALASAGLVLLPYMTWNQRNFGRFTPVPVASTIGQSLYLATWDSLPLEDRLFIIGEPPTPGTIRSGLAGRVETIRAEALRAAPAYPVAQHYPRRQFEKALSDAFAAAAIERARERPGEAVTRVLNSTWRLLNTGVYPKMPPAAELILKTVSFSVFIAAVVGLLVALTVRPGSVSLVPLVVWLSLQTPHLALHTEARYTAPIRLIVVLYSSVAVVWILSVARRRWPGGSAARAHHAR
jgi:hypothetical protein